MIKKYKDSDKAHIKSVEDYNTLYQESIENPDKFWASIANRITWYSKWDNVSDVDFKKGKISWFENAKLNASYNCLDRHVESGNGDQIALIWEGNNPESDKTYTYKELLTEVSKFANVLKVHNIKKGDRVCLYMQMIPELSIAMLACARIGAVHSIVFGAFSPASLTDRINDSKCKALITQILE
jgi:Acyl-coenzyme A synthetases/AMP-(fatty) acid ligases